MIEYITKRDAELTLRQFKKTFRRVDEICAVNGCILEIQEMDPVDVVSRDVLDQVRWERDVAISQLESYGISLGEKADVTKVVHGRWIKAECSEKDGNARCSVCDHWDWNDCRYCAACGAKMDLED